MIMSVVDLCSGLGGATQAFRDRGHDVFSVELNPDFNADLHIDVREMTTDDIPRMPDFVWASPPCTSFTRVSMPWYPDTTPDMSVVEACIRLIKETKPRWWALENVRGSAKFIRPLLGQEKKRIAGHYIWGEFPIFDAHSKKCKWKMSGMLPAERSRIPYSIGLAMCLSLESVR